MVGTEMHGLKNMLTLCLLASFLIIGGLPGWAQTAPSKPSASGEKKVDDSLKMPVIKIQEVTRDPFVPLVSSAPSPSKGPKNGGLKPPGPKSGGGKPVKPTEPTVVLPTLTGIMMTAGRPQAILVEGDTTYFVRVGESFKGGKIVSITRNSVTLLMKGKQYTIKLAQ
ncbi:MAG: hypothetical protein HYU64_01455 [Armatimonadetes bacterium]|nr:hypothetical protein [Armatimonadota bacterium]